MHIYAFGSICRGEFKSDSDIDLLAIVSDPTFELDPDRFSIYEYGRILELWNEGNPFAWHLATESRILYADNDIDWLHELGKPAPYVNGAADCRKFYDIFLQSRAAIMQDRSSATFELSTIFLSIRNIATCFSLGSGSTPTFARHSALRLGVASLPITSEAFAIFERARVLSTRGLGKALGHSEVDMAVSTFGSIDMWMTYLVRSSEGI